MFIDIHELELHSLEFEEELRPQAIDLGPDVRQRTALKTKGRAELLEEHQGRRASIKDIRLVGAFATQLEINCARCLDPVVRDVDKSFDLLYRPQGVDAGAQEISVTQAEAEIGYYTGSGLMLEDVLREQVLLAMPLKTVCREDCRGLCPLCGKNRNLEACSCASEVKDPRWDALKELRGRLP
jgi:uncharacterized protein